MTKLTLPTVADVESKIENRTPPPTFSHVRWPYTYACDLVRTHPEVVPQEVHTELFKDSPGVIALYDGRPRVLIESRADASGVRKVWATLIAPDDVDATNERLARVLALVYCNLEQIEVPRQLVHDMYQRGELGWASA